MRHGSISSATVIGMCRGGHQYIRNIRVVSLVKLNKDGERYIYGDLESWRGKEWCAVTKYTSKVKIVIYIETLFKRE